MKQNQDEEIQNQKEWCKLTSIRTDKESNFNKENCPKEANTDMSANENKVLLVVNTSSK